MLMVTVPKTMEVGDAEIVTINGKQREVELGYEEILIDGNDTRRILSVIVAGDDMTLLCD